MNYLGGLRSKREAEKIRALLIKRYRPWIPGGLDMVSRSLTIEKIEQEHNYPWRIVHTPQVRTTNDLVENTWQIENFALKALEFYQGYLVGCQANKGRKKNTRRA
jgi:hypothetical protein